MHESDGSKFAIRLVGTEILSIILMDKKWHIHRYLAKKYSHKKLSKITVSQRYNMPKKYKVAEKNMLIDLIVSNFKWANS